MTVHSEKYLEHREPWLAEMVLSMDENVFDNYTMFRSLNTRLQIHLRNKGFQGKCHAASVGIRTFDNGYEVHTKVIVGGAGSFVHVDQYDEWPSETLDAKIALVVG